MDYAATTPIDPRVFKKMKPFFDKKFGNTTSIHFYGRETKTALEESRTDIAKFIGARPEEFIFTSSVSESNNMALKGIAFANKDKGKHIIISSIEHDCVLNSSKWLKKQGFDITYLPVDKYGFADLNVLENAIRKDTILASVMHSNNEIGTLQPVRKIGKICNDHGVYFHSDAAQSFGKVPINVKKDNIDILTVSSHKIYGPKGVGGAYIRKGVKIDPLIHGGGQEFNLRSSTSNTTAIVGFAEAIRIAKKEMKKESIKLTKLRDKLIKGVLKIENSHLNGHPKKRLPNITNFWFSFIEGEALVMQLDLKGIAASSGSACSSKTLDPSHVLLAIGLKPEEAHGSLRLSLGRWSKKQDVDYVLKTLPKVVKNLRNISPFKGKW